MRKTIFTLFVAAATLLSCSSDDSSSITPPVDASGTLLKRIVETFEDGSTGTYDFTYDGNKLTSWVIDAGTADVETITYTYTNDLLTGIEADLIDTIDDNTVVIAYDSNNNISVVTRTDSSGTIQTTYVYNNDGTVTATEGGGATTTYNITSGNIVEEAFVFNADNETRTVSFDDKNGCFKNIHQAETLSLLNDIYTVYNTMNNETSVVVTGTNVFPDDSYNVTYQYNSNNYPVSSTRTEAPGTVDEEVITSVYTYY